MKQCPACHSLFSPEDVFCPNDGATLIVTTEQNAGRVVVTWDDDPQGTPTQFVPTPQQVRSAATPSWLYALTGGLAAVVLMGGAFVLYLVSRDKPTDQIAANTASPSVSAQPSPTSNATQNVPNTAANAANALANAANAAAPQRNSPPSRPLSRQFSETYIGKVGDNGVQMDLRRSGSSLSGTVRPYGSSADIYINGYIGDDGDFSMDEKSDIGVVTGVYRGWLRDDGTMNGTWSKPGGDRTRSISLRRK